MNQSRNYFSGNTGYYGIDSEFAVTLKENKRKMLFSF